MLFLNCILIKRFNGILHLYLPLWHPCPSLYVHHSVSGSHLKPLPFHLSQTKLNALTHALIKTDSVFVSRESSEKQWPSASLHSLRNSPGPQDAWLCHDDFLFHFGSWRAMLYLYPGSWFIRGSSVGTEGGRALIQTVSCLAKVWWWNDVLPSRCNLKGGFGNMGNFVVNP